MSANQLRDMNMKIFTQCRICSSQDLTTILDLGSQSMSAVFPEKLSENPEKSPLELMRCRACGFVQLRHSADVSDMYGVSYGYHSSLSPTMVKHLDGIVERLVELAKPSSTDSVLDIGSNDGTLLNSYSKHLSLTRYGIDPSAQKFLKYYESSIKVAVDYFNGSSGKNLFGEAKHKIITSIAMFYDLDDPLGFASDIHNSLHDDGVWALELSYLPTLLTQLTYDQICHEHVGYYALRDLKRIFDQLNYKIVDINFNDVNGGSIFVVVAKSSSTHREATKLLLRVLEQEAEKLSDEAVKRFARRVEMHKTEVKRLLKILNNANKKVFGFGASTKGNVVLNYAGLSANLLPAIGDLNKEKHGRYTPGTLIPIRSHEAIESESPDYLIVFVWHFRSEVIRQKKQFLDKGGVLVFLLPRIHFVDRDNYINFLDTDFRDLAYES